MPSSRTLLTLLALAPLALLIAWQPACSSPASAPHGDTASVVAEL